MLNDRSIEKAIDRLDLREDLLSFVRGREALKQERRESLSVYRSNFRPEYAKLHRLFVEQVSSTLSLIVEEIDAHEL